MYLNKTHNRIPKEISCESRVSLANYTATLKAPWKTLQKHTQKYSGVGTHGNGVPTRLFSTTLLTILPIS